jgi:diguanylate cyclase (GGDEF)-like protein
MSVRHVCRLFLLALTLAAIAVPAASSPPAAAARPPSAAFQGMPLLQRYTPDDYQAEAANLAVLQAPDRMLYVGNLAGLLRFDGSQWDLLELPRKSNVRAMAIGGDGRLYLGGYDQFGVLETDAGGQMQYHDLRPRFGIDPAEVAFGDVWSVVRGADGIYFRTTEHLFLLADDGRHRQWPTDDRLRGMFPIGDQLYARVHGQGLSRFVDGSFVLLPGGERYAEQPLFSLFGTPDGLLLVGPDGFQRADARGLHALPSEATALFASTQPYSGIALPDGSYLFGTYTGELLHFSADLQLLAQHRIGAYTVLDLTRDEEGGVWAATEGDLVRLRVPAPWSLYGAADGLIGTVADSVVHADALWVATSQGVFRGALDRGQMRFELAIETVLEANVLRSTADGLLVADREGVLLLRDGASRTERVLTLNSAYAIRPVIHAPDRLFVFGELELVCLLREDGRWQVEHRWPLDGISIAELHEASRFEFWIGDYRSGVIRWLLDPETGEIVERRAFGPAEGLDLDPEFDTVMHEFDGQIYAVSGRRVFRRDGSRFTAVDLAPFNLVERPWEMAVVDNRFGAFAHTRRELYRRAPGQAEWRPVQFGAAIARGFAHVHVGADERLRILTWNGLLQFDPEVADLELPPLAVSLRGAQLRRADGRLQQLPLALGDSPLWLPPAASLSLDFRLLTMEPGSEFRFRVDGLMDDWTAWGPASSPAMSLRHPGPGRYTVQIEGRTRSGRLAEPLSIAIEAAPRWWQTPFATLAALLLLVGLVALVAQLIARLRYRQYLILNQRLETRIAERTAELEAANQKLSELATEDSLTGVANRRALEQALLREWERCRELGQPLSVVMVDVDHFKQYNDVHGHLVGDQQLVRVARLLSEHVHSVRELLARFGGEEFALVLPGTPIEEALARAEAVRMAFDQGSGPTVSLGVATQVPNQRQVPDDLVRAADLALYAAKRAGRNRVMRAEQPVAERIADL